MKKLILFFIISLSIHNIVAQTPNDPFEIVDFNIDRISPTSTFIVWSVRNDYKIGEYVIIRNGKELTHITPDHMWSTAYTYTDDNVPYSPFGYWYFLIVKTPSGFFPIAWHYFPPRFKR